MSPDTQLRIAIYIFQTYSFFFGINSKDLTAILEPNQNTRMSQFGTEAVQAVVGSIVVIGSLTCYALLHRKWDLKTTQMNVQCSLIRELMIYEIELGHNVTKATKNICCMKDEGAVDHSTVNRWFKKFCLGWVARRSTIR